MSSFKILSFVTCALGCAALLFGAAANAQVILPRESAPPTVCETPDWQAAPEAKKWSPENYYTTWYQVPNSSADRPPVTLEYSGVQLRCESIATASVCLAVGEAMIKAMKADMAKKQNKKKK